MIKIKATFCRHCEAPRNDSFATGHCHWCNTPLYEKEIELPELSSSEKEAAKKYLEEHRSVSGGSSSVKDSSLVVQEIVDEFWLKAKSEVRSV